MAYLFDQGLEKEPGLGLDLDLAAGEWQWLPSTDRQTKEKEKEVEMSTLWISLQVQFNSIVHGFGLNWMMMTDDGWPFPLPSFSCFTPKFKNQSIHPSIIIT